MSQPQSGETRSSATAPAPDPLAPEAIGRPHLVVVTTRAAEAGSEAERHGSVLVTRFWHPRNRAWAEHHFESLEHAARLFVDESGWQLVQQQALDAPHAYELIFQARRLDFARPSTEDILREIGLTPEGIARMMDPPPPSEA